MRNSLLRWSIILIWSVLFAPGVQAQGEPIDQGNLSIRIAGVEVAREQFNLVTGRRGGSVGSTLHAVASYPAVRPASRYDAILERAGGQTLAAFQVELAGAHPGRTVAELVRNRLTVRAASGDREMAHEYPAGADMVALDDSVYSLWLTVADLATEQGAGLQGIYPRSGTRVRFTAQRKSDPDGTPSILLTGDIQGTILLDTAGRFNGLLLPGKRIEVLRTSE